MKRSVYKPILAISIAVLLLSELPGAGLARQLGTAAKQAAEPASAFHCNGQTFVPSPQRRVLYLWTNQVGKNKQVMDQHGKNKQFTWNPAPGRPGPLGSEWQWSRDDDCALINNGSNRDSIIIMAPPVPAKYEDNYEVEAEIFVGLVQCPAGFGIVVDWYWKSRPDSGEGPYSSTDCDRHAGIWEGPLAGATRLNQEPFDMTTDWHIYRLDVHGTTLASYMDDRRLVKADHRLRRYKDGHIGLGLWTHGDQLYVQRFEVCANTGYPCDLSVK